MSYVSSEGRNIFRASVVQEALSYNPILTIVGAVFIACSVSYFLTTIFCPYSDTDDKCAASIRYCHRLGGAEQIKFVTEQLERITNQLEHITGLGDQKRTRNLSVFGPRSTAAHDHPSHTSNTVST
jgi:hypothetical protein